MSVKPSSLSQSFFLCVLHFRKYLSLYLQLHRFFSVIYSAIKSIQWILILCIVFFFSFVPFKYVLYLYLLSYCPVFISILGNIYNIVTGLSADRSSLSFLHPFWFIKIILVSQVIYTCFVLFWYLVIFLGTMNFILLLVEFCCFPSNSVRFCSGMQLSYSQINSAI